MNVPSPHQLKLARFDKPHFRAPRRANHRKDEWTWQRAIYRATRALMRAKAGLANDVTDTLRALSRALAAVKAARPIRRPQLSKLTVAPGWYQASASVTFGATPRQPGAVRRMVRRVGRRSAPVRRHRLENLSSLSHDAYMTALTARQAYVIANLLRLKGLTATRAFGEPSWREARRADHYATA